MVGVAGGHQGADKVVARVRAAFGDQRGEVSGQFTGCGGGRTGPAVSAGSSSAPARPAASGRNRLRSGRRDAEQFADHGNRELEGEMGHEVDLAAKDR